MTVPGTRPEIDHPQEERRLTPGQQWEQYGVYPYLLAKVAFWSLFVVAVVYALLHISAVAVPIFASLLIAYVLSPTVNLMEKKKVPRSLGILIIIASLLSFFVVFSIFLWPTIATQIEKISQRAPEIISVVETRTLPWLTDTFGLELPETMAGAMEQYGEDIREALPGVAEQIGTWTATALTRAGNWVVSLANIILIPFFTFYFLRDFERGKRVLLRFIPPRKEEVILDRLARMDLTVGQWFRGQIQVSCILAVLYAIGLGLVYGLTGHSVQSGIVIGLLTGFLNVIPYVGFAVGSVLAFLVVLIDWTGWGAFLGVAIAFTVIQTVESYYITPKVVGDKVGLSPVTVIIVLLIGGQLAGLVGVLLAIPVAAAFKVLIPDIIEKYHKSATYSGQYTAPAMVISSPSNWTQSSQSDDSIAVDGLDGDSGHSVEKEEGTVIVTAKEDEEESSEMARDDEGSGTLAPRDSSHENNTTNKESSDPSKTPRVALEPSSLKESKTPKKKGKGPKGKPGKNGES